MQSSGTSTPAGDLPWLRPGLSEKGRCTPRDSPSPPLADTISGRAIPLGPAGAHKSILLLHHNLYPSEHPPSLAGCPSPWAAGRLFPAAAPAGPPSCPSGGRVCPGGQGPACARGLRPALPDAGTGEGPSSPGAPGLQRRGSPSGPAGGAVFAPAVFGQRPLPPRTPGPPAGAVHAVIVPPAGSAILCADAVAPDWPPQRTGPMPFGGLSFRFVFFASFVVRVVRGRRRRCLPGMRRAVAGRATASARPADTKKASTARGGGRLCRRADAAPGIRTACRAGKRWPRSRRPARRHCSTGRGSGAWPGPCARRTWA